MDMTFSTVHGHHSFLSNMGVLFTLIYGFWCLVVLIRRKSKRPAFLAIIPFLVSVPIAWADYVNVIRGMALSGGGRASTAAGFAEALMSLALGAIASAVLAIVASIRGPRGGDARSSAAAVLVQAILAGLTFWFAQAVPNGTLDLRLLHQLSPAIILSAVVLATLSAGLLMRHLRVSPIAIAVIMAIVVMVVRAQVNAYVRVAIGG